MSPLFWCYFRLDPTARRRGAPGASAGLPVTVDVKGDNQIGGVARQLPTQNGLRHPHDVSGCKLRHNSKEYWVATPERG